MKPYPFFSIIIPTYNRAGFLKIAVDSVLAQTYTDFEIIIVDDGSRDGTKKTAETYIDTSSAIRYIYQENKGPAAARNAGLAAAQGEWICFLDSDDRFRINKLAAANDYIKKYPDYKIFHTEELWYRNSGLLTQRACHKKPHGFVFPQAVKLCCISISTAAAHKTVFSSVGNFDESLPACEDYDFWLRASARYPVYLIPQFLTIKEGGHSDQRSKHYPAMDKFRIYSLTKILESNTLDNEQHGAALRELKRKCAIYMQGAQKRGKISEAERCKELIDKLTK